MYADRGGNLTDIISVGCWAHARRKFTDALKKAQKTAAELTKQSALLANFIK